MRPDSVDEIILEETTSWHILNTAVFHPYLISLLEGEERRTEALITVQLQNIGDVIEEERQLCLRWHPSSAPELPLGATEKIITELAACALAGVVVHYYAGVHMYDVATEGDRFDYWCDLIGDTEGDDVGLEVSGTQSSVETEVANRQRQKVRQLLSNPHGMNGFVVVSSFATNTVRFSYHRFGEGE
jgi:hypothetical protein